MRDPWVATSARRPCCASSPRASRLSEGRSMSISLQFADTSIHLQVVSLDGAERLGEPSEITVLATSREPIEREALFRQGCIVQLEGTHESRSIACAVARVSQMATSSRESARRYKLVL